MIGEVHISSKRTPQQKYLATGLVINYTTASNTSIIVERKTSYCSSLYLYSGSIYKAIVHKHVLFHFQTKDNDMHVYADSWHSEDDAKQQTFKPVSFIMHFYIG